MTTTTASRRRAPLVLGPVLRSPHAEDRGFAGFRPRSVPVALNRSPDPRETGLIEGGAAHAQLSAAGYDGVSVRVETSRLEVDGTTVSAMRGGLLLMLAELVDTVNVAGDATPPGAGAGAQHAVDEQDVAM